MTKQNHTSQPSFTYFLTYFSLLITLLLLFAVTAFFVLIGVTAQAGITLGLTGSAAAGLIPDGTIPDPCETMYNCKPASAVLMERGHIIEK